MNEQGKHVLDRLRVTTAKGEAPKASDEEFAALVKYACQLEEALGADDPAMPEIVLPSGIKVPSADGVNPYIEPKK